MKIINQSEHKTSSWSGGKTTELYIHPTSSSFSARDFEFRISTATVEVASSNFTPLEGFKRTLMVLEGEMMLEHDKHHTASLKPLQMDNFQGGWQTTSKGCCTDFNLIFSKEVDGTLRGKELPQNKRETIEFSADYNFLFLYKGELAINGGTYGDKTLFTFDKGEKIEIVSTAQSLLVKAAVTIDDQTTP